MTAPFDPAAARRTPPKRLRPWKIARINWLPGLIARPLFGQPLAPTEGEWERVQQALNQGDPAMDKVVDWMFENGPRHTKPLFDKALTEGIASIPNPPAVLAEFFTLVDRDPPWLDRSQLPLGAQSAQMSGPVGFFVLRDMALMGGYAYFNSMNQTLGASGSLGKDTALRLGETGKWLNDVIEEGALERFGVGFITTIRVRMVHALVRRNLLKNRDWGLDTWGLPINQVDMTATYLAFGPVALLGARLFGVPVRKKQAAATMHMWRYIGWLMGVDEQWLAITEGDGLRKLYHTFLTHSLPDDKIRQLGQALRDEPLTRHLPGLDNTSRLARLKRWYQYQRHLSNSALILGPVQRRQLGLPMTILPWYPLLTAPFRFITLNYYQLRGGKTLENYARRSREQQLALLQSYFGERQHDIIQPKAGHPAHLG